MAVGNLFAIVALVWCTFLLWEEINTHNELKKLGTNYNITELPANTATGLLVLMVIMLIVSYIGRKCRPIQYTYIVLWYSSILCLISMTLYMLDSWLGNAMYSSARSVNATEKDWCILYSQLFQTYVELFLVGLISSLALSGLVLAVAYQHASRLLQRKR
jgi:hypothetical protein